MKSAFGYMTLRGCTLGYALALTLAAAPAAAQSTWFGAQQSAAVDDPKAVAGASFGGLMFALRWSTIPRP